jgi:hypothetical protein
MTGRNCTALEDVHVLAVAAEQGWDLAAAHVGGTSVWRWASRADVVSPTFRRRKSALTWMSERLHRERASRWTSGFLATAVGSDDMRRRPDHSRWAQDRRALVEREAARWTLELDTVNRALQHDLVLVESLTAKQRSVFDWRSPAGTIGPRFDDRDLAIDWMVDWLSYDGPSGDI